MPLSRVHERLSGRRATHSCRSAVTRERREASRQTRVRRTQRPAERSENARRFTLYCKKSSPPLIIVLLLRRAKAARKGRRGKTEESGISRLCKLYPHMTADTAVHSGCPCTGILAGNVCKQHDFAMIARCSHSYAGRGGRGVGLKSRRTLSGPAGRGRGENKVLAGKLLSPALISSSLSALRRIYARLTLDGAGLTAGPTHPAPISFAASISSSSCGCL